MPCAVTSMMSSSPLTWRIPATLPVRDVTRMSMIPLPPRPCSRKSATGVRLPKPRSATTRMSPLSSAGNAAMVSTKSSPRSETPRTPAATRPMERTPLSGKRMPMPLCVPRKTWLAPSVRRTSSRSSPSSSAIAMIPVERGLA